MYETTLNGILRDVVADGGLVLNFMKLRAQERPYPTYLYRAHVHGHPFPRFEDDCSGQYADTFGSDHHLWVEFDARSEIPMPTSEATEHWTVHDVLEELREHLNKTQNNLQRQMSGEEPYWSRLVSLSGDFRWTTQRICKTGRLATEGLQIPGLAIFETSVVKREVHIWRVQDMFDFLDSRTKGTVIFSRDLRRWVANADEYVCWALVPKEALISFIPLPNLTQQFGSGDEIFLRKDFVFSTYLSDFHRQPLEKLSFAEYIRRLSGFMSEVIGNISSWTKIEELDVGALGYPFLNPSQWGYDVAAFGQDLDDKVTSTIDAALEKARTREYAADYAYEVETVVD